MKGLHEKQLNEFLDTNNSRILHNFSECEFEVKERKKGRKEERKKKKRKKKIFAFQH
jgi:hypothetical protein